MPWHDVNDSEICPQFRAERLAPPRARVREALDAEPGNGAQAEVRMERGRATLLVPSLRFGPHQAVLARSGNELCNTLARFVVTDFRMSLTLGEYAGPIGRQFKIRRRQVSL